MRLIIVAALTLLLTETVTGSAYEYARRCRSQTEPCIKLRCTNGGLLGKFPFHSQYGCCANKVYDEKDYVCVKSNGVTSAKSCNPCTQFRCRNSQCVLKEWRCNYQKECKDGSDEVGCGFCSSAEFRCDNGRCIDRESVCDKKNDCGDGSDEFGCMTKTGGACGANSFRCGNDLCIPKHLVCNRYDNCKDKSDEQGCQSHKLIFGKKRDAVLGLDEEQSDEGGNAVDAETGTTAS